MISALLKKKVSVDLKEDSLTSCVFDTLFLLPKDIFWEILRKAVIATTKDITESLPQTITKLEYEFWPRWDATDTDNTSYVEPDLFIRCQNCDVIIEAKRKEEWQQDDKQWEKEIIAYSNEHGDKKPLYFIALGGLYKREQKSVEIEKKTKSRTRV